MVSAGWDTMAAAKPPIRPDPKFTAVEAPADIWDLSKLLRIASETFSKATNLVMV
jgi:hypothetical protein